MSVNPYALSNMNKINALVDQIKITLTLEESRSVWLR